MRKLAILLIVLMVVSVCFLSGCDNQSSNSGSIIVESHNIRDYIFGGKEVYGTIKNVGDKNVDYTEVTVKFYDSDNELLHTEKTQIQYIAKGEIKNFSVQYTSNDPYYSAYHHYTVSVWSRI